jgi:hypothetical protein
MTDSMHTVTGGCYCGNVLVKIRLTRAPASYNPRACDCEFCRKHGAAYISDAAGTMEVEIGTAGDRGSYRQGSEAADCLFCRRCGVFTGVTCEIDGRFVWRRECQESEPGGGLRAGAVGLSEATRRL